MCCIRALVAAVLLAVHCGPALAQTPPPPTQDWISEGGRDHPLVGVIWSARAGRTATSDELAAALTASRIALFGEVHDNADHHRLQAWAVDVLATRKLGPGVVFEHIRGNQQAAVDAAIAEAKGEPETRARFLLEKLDWKSSGWPSADIFLPLFEAPIRHGLSIMAGDPPRDTVKAVARSGASELPAGDQPRLGLNKPLEEPLNDALLAELVDSHCDLMPKTAFGNMSFAQRYRDAHIADAAIAAVEQHGSAIVMTGNGHVRLDRSVPWYLRSRAAGENVLAVMPVEVRDGMTDATAYVLRDPDGKPVADFIVFTPRAERPDPCTEMRKRFRGNKRG